MNELLTQPYEIALNYINAIACGLIAVRIFVWRTKADIPDFTTRLLAYLFIISFADVTLESFSINPRETSIPEAIISVLLCIVCYVNKKWSFSMRDFNKNT